METQNVTDMPLEIVQAETKKGEGVPAFPQKAWQWWHSAHCPSQALMAGPRLRSMSL